MSGCPGGRYPRGGSEYSRGLVCPEGMSILEWSGGVRPEGRGEYPRGGGFTTHNISFHRCLSVHAGWVSQKEEGSEYPRGVSVQGWGGYIQMGVSI